MLRLTASIDAASFTKFSRGFGDTSNNALVRVGVFTAREAAVLTQPRGKSRKASMRSIGAGARAVVRAVPNRQFGELLKARKPRFKMGGRWVALTPDKILQGADEINKWIDGHRGPQGRARRLPPEEMGIARQKDFAKALAARKRRAGKAKGAWLGAGIACSRLPQGRGRERIGKNFIGWAQKHAELGKARWRPRMLGKSELRLIASPEHTGNPKIFSRRAERESTRRAFKKVLKWYKREVKRLSK